jgi:hypothetical protein
MTEVVFYNSSISFNIKGFSFSETKELISILMGNKPVEPVEELIPEPIVEKPVEELISVKIEEPTILEPDIVPQEIYENDSEISDDTEQSEEIEEKSVCSEPVSEPVRLPLEFPEFKSRQEFCEKILSNFFTDKSYKNYWVFWNNPILDSMRRGDLDNVVLLLQEEIKKNEGKSYRNIYNFFILIFKINKHYSIFNDISKINTLFEPIRALKTQQSSVKNSEKKSN